MRSWFVLFIMLFFVMPTMAQDNALAYGDTVTGEITSREFEIEYPFQGAAQDVILIQLTPDDALDGLTQPSIILLSEDGDVLATVDASISTATLIYELPKEGEYLILASRRDGRSGEAEGGYTLSLSNIPLLELDTPFDDETTNEENRYYALRMSDPFSLTYQRLNGDFHPEIKLSVITDSFFGNENLEVLATMSGEQLLSGALGHSGSDDLIIVSVGRAAFSFSFNTESVSYNLEVIEMSE